jgi:cyclic beta-1,2-glucan synthetase
MRALPDPPPLERLDDPAPHGRWLSNGRYTVLLTGAGTGRSSFEGFALTPFRADRVEDADGLFLYLRDAQLGTLGSPTPRPLGTAARRRTVSSRPGVVSFACELDGLELRLDACVLPDAHVELRRLVLGERAGRARRLELTSCAEVALDRPAAFAAHPAFSKLFVETRFDAARRSLVARRRPRAPDERVAWLAHALPGAGPLEHETDRARFFGRGGSPARPQGLSAPLSGSVGSVLDPVLCLREAIELAPGGRAERVFVLAAAGDAAALAAALDRAAAPGAASAAFAAAEAHETALLERLGLDARRGAYLDEFLVALVYGHPALRAPEAVARRGRGHVSDLWGAGFGDRPLLVAPLAGPADLELARELLVARRFWAAKGVEVDLLLLCRAGAEVVEAARALADGAGPGGRVVAWRVADEAARSAIALAWAAACLPSAWPELGGDAAPRAAPRFRVAVESAPIPLPPERLEAENEHGGFAEGGREYVVRLEGSRRPPLPWINCLANPGFGALVSESGATTTWSRNSREHRLTPWNNDPVRDPHGEALYLRDESAGVFWSPTPGPVPDGAPYEVRHGFGATLFRHRSQTLVQEVTVLVPPDQPVRVLRVRVKNVGPARRLSLFAYQRLVLGSLPEESARSITTAHDPESGALFARNGLAGEFGDAVVFAAALAPAGAGLHFTADRAAFLGRGGDPAAPRALTSDEVLDGRTGAGLDPALVFQVRVELPVQGEIECGFLLGEASGPGAARELVRGLRAPGALEAALEATRRFWREHLQGVQVSTPCPALDPLLNGWLGYQATACRLWGRTAFYQSGGAFGFRDQLQDALNLLPLRPALARAQILLHAAHQFVEGDVLHWWHPPASRGTRTRMSDDLLWLPHLAAEYVRATGDASVLDEAVGFRRARALAPGEDEAYLATEPAAETASLYEHGCRALDRSLAVGRHGLPLMGTGDWNDGMNRVGREGRGESVWLGFFLYATLGPWSELARRRGDVARAERYRAHREALAPALEDAWDGAWYRRAYYDDGTPLGSASSQECRIDALVQAWAVLSGAAPPERAAACLDAALAELYSPASGVLRLLAPPFDRTPHDPGYIRGYLPGIRENGGQYTHAACWVVRALAELGRREEAAALLERLSPVWHAATERIGVYRVEPYVVAADVYGAPPHEGRGGWTWYTGSAGWWLRVALESVLGVWLEGGDTLRIRPCIPDAWPRYAVRLRLPDGRTCAAIEVENPAGCAEAVTALVLDGRGLAVEGGVGRATLPLDGGVHRVAVTLGARRSRS